VGDFGLRLRRLWVAAGLAVPAGAGMGALVGAVLLLMTRPEWQARQTPLTIVGFLVPCAFIGGAVAAVAAVGAVAAVILTRRTATQPPAAAAGGSAIAIAIVVSVVMMLGESAAAVFLVLFAVLVAAPLAWLAARLALREKSVTTPESPSPIQS